MISMDCVGFGYGRGLVAEEEATGVGPVRRFEKLPQLQVRPTADQG